MELTTRYDRAAKVRIATDGTVTGVAARVHTASDPLVYEREDGTFHETRGLDEVRSIAAQLNVGNVPLLYGHPPKLGMRDDLIGKVTGARVDGQEVVATIALDATGRAYVEAGAKELSLGYAVGKLVAGSQTKVRVDHLALVRLDEVARCGPRCSLRSDCGCKSTTRLSRADINRIGAMVRELDLDRLRRAGIDPANRSDAFVAAALAQLDDNVTEEQAARSRAAAVKNARSAMLARALAGNTIKK